MASSLSNRPKSEKSRPNPTHGQLWPGARQVAVCTQILLAIVRFTRSRTVGSRRRQSYFLRPQVSRILVGRLTPVTN